jgi:hypothetical protein
MTYRIHLIAALPLIATAACVPPPAGPATAYPFVGAWDCEIATFTFTDTTYDNGSETLPIRAIDQSGNAYTLGFDDGYVVTLGMNADGTMSWLSGATGDQFTCQRL